MIQINRREFGAVSTACISGAILAQAPVKAASEGIIDTHTHFYDPTRPQGVPWPGKNDRLLYRKVLPDEFKKLVMPQGVTGTVVVEASPLLEDNQWLLDLAKDDPYLPGIVGHLTPGSDDFGKQFDRFAKDRKFQGIRISEGGLIKGLDQKSYLDNLRKLADADRQLDVNGGPGTPAVVAKLAQAIPALRIVINHAANVRIDGKAPPDAWQKAMQEAARQKNVWCKVSALVEGTGKSDGSAPKEVEFYKPVLDHLWESFGEDRLIFGSNWPVSVRFATYATLFEIVDKYFTAKGKPVRAKFFAKNALAAYRWPTVRE